MASPTRWACVWVDSRSWWWTGKPGMLWFMGSQRVGHDWATELNWTELKWGLNPKVILRWCIYNYLWGNVFQKRLLLFFSFHNKLIWIQVKSFSYSCARKVMGVVLGLHKTLKCSAVRRKGFCWENKRTCILILKRFNLWFVVQLHIMSDSLWAHGLQHDRHSSPSPSPKSSSNSCSLMPSNHLVLCCTLLLLPSIFPSSGSFPVSRLFISGGQNFGASTSASVLPMNIQDWFPSGLTEESRFDLFAV